MCSNMWAKPVLPMGSCEEPASTIVKKEKTGASGRSQITMVSPFGSFLTVMSFSKDATSCAAARAVRMRRSTRARGRSMRYIIGPPKDWAKLHGRTFWDNHLGCEGQKFEITWRAGRLSNGYRTLIERGRGDLGFCVGRALMHNACGSVCDGFDH